MFQSIMDNIFQNMLNNGIIVYLDYILIYTKNEKEHRLLVQEVLSWLYKAGLEVNLKKGSFHIRKVEFLDSIISEQGIEISLNMIEEVMNWSVP